MKVVRAAALAGAVALAWGSGAEAQTIWDEAARLLVTIPGQPPLMALRPANPANPGQGLAPQPSFALAGAGSSGQAIAGVLLLWVRGAGAAVPIANAGDPWSFRFERGIPVRQEGSRGPVFGERAQTVGRGRLLLAVHHSLVRFSTRHAVGGPMRLNFVHSAPGSNEVGANDYIATELNADVTLNTLALTAVAGLHPRVEASVMVPLVHSTFDGTAHHHIMLANPAAPATTLFGGSPYSPVLEADDAFRRSAWGWGDVRARVKVALVALRALSGSFIAERRFATGEWRNFHGAGANSWRLISVLSGDAGRLTPSLSAGYLIWGEPRNGGRLLNNEVQVTAGVDMLVTRRLTLAVTSLANYRRGGRIYELPTTVTLQRPGPTQVPLVDIPAIDNKAFALSVGGKYTGPGGLGVVANLMLPFQERGPQFSYVATVGLEWAFRAVR